MSDNDSPSERPDDTAAPASARGPRRLVRRVLLTAGPLLAAVVGAYLYYTGGRYVDTENAYVKADKALISAQVSGPITAVAVKENQRVTAGQPLFRLDAAPFKLALDRAGAHLDEVRSDLEALKASYEQKRRELGLAEANAAYAKREYHRQDALAHKGLTSQERLDQARHSFNVAQKQVGVLNQELASILANLNGDASVPLNDYPRYLEAKAERDQAALNLQHAVVRAPFNGVASKTPEPGDFVNAGEPVMSVVADHNVWIKANFKETQLTHVRPGQAVTVHVDTYPNHEWHGRVTSISQATGSEFSILPPQNASGNWVKVVQWIPLRVAIHAQSQDPPLRAGMSTEVTIDTGYRRPLPGMIARVASWFDGLVRISQAKGEDPRS